jgi:spermidine synthase
MWLKEAQKNDFQQNLDTNEKIFDKKSEINSIEIYKSGSFGDVFVQNGVSKFCSVDIANISEMLAHTALCSHPKATRVLLVGANFRVIKEILKHKCVETIDVVESDEVVIEALKAYNDSVDVVENSKVNLIIKDGIEYIRDKEDDSYDIILINAEVENSEISKDVFFAHTKRVLDAKGLISVVCDSYMFSVDTLIDTMQNMGKYYKIVMPQRYEMYTTVGVVANIVVATNKYHPTADMILNKSDLLDDLEYYHSDLHKSSFVLPTYLLKALKEVAKN